MTFPINQVGWYCGLKGPFANKSEALSIRQTVIQVGYKPPQAEAISYRVDKHLWKSPNILVQK